MIVDFGGSALEVSIVDCFENIIEITAITGDNCLGGDDIDKTIATHFCKENGLTEEWLDQLEAWQDETPLFDGFWADDVEEGADDC